MDKTIVGAVRLVQRLTRTLDISPIFILPEYQNLGIGKAAMEALFFMYPEKIWRLTTIAEEIRDCRFYESCGFVRTGYSESISSKMTLVGYEKCPIEQNRTFPTRQAATDLLLEAEQCNPGPWGNHSRVAAHCAEYIARACGMDAEKAYILGLLHDIGRKFGKRHLGHVSDGYSYLCSLGYDEAAKICLTHSFNNRNVEEYIGKFDTTEAELQMIVSALNQIEMDDYDRLIQLCDSIAGSEGVLDIEDRMNDVKQRYGSYPQTKWNSNMQLKTYFESQAGRTIYDVVERDAFAIL